MIPKLIHFCWLSGDPYPPKIQFCIDSWKRLLPDYEVVLWDTKRFDVNSISWTRQAFEKKKYAFVADYIRLYAVYNYGGIYLDSDVEVIRSFDDLLHLPYFTGVEVAPDGIEMAAFGAEKGTVWLKDMMEYYEGRDFIDENGKMELVPMPYVMKGLISRKYHWTHIRTPEEFDSDPSMFCLLPVYWFCAHTFDSVHGSWYYIREETHCIHHFANSWSGDEYPGGPLHKLFYKLIGKDWKFLNKRFRLYGKSRRRGRR